LDLQYLEKLNISIISQLIRDKHFSLNLVEKSIKLNKNMTYLEDFIDKNG